MKMRQFLVYPYPQEVGPAPSWAAGVIRDEKNERMVPTEAVGCMLAATGKARWKSQLNLTFRAILQETATAVDTNPA